MNYNKKAWTMEEEDEMLKSLRKREDFDKIAERHDRTINAIRLRFGMVCKKEIENTSKTIQQLCQEYHLKEEQIVRYINDFENIQKKNQQQKTIQQQPSFFDPSEISIIKEEVLMMNEKLDKIYKHVKKMMEMMKKGHK